DDTFLVRQGPDFYGAGTFWQIGFRGGFRFDTRNRSVAATQGVVFDGGGTLWPSWMSVDATFGEVHGELATYLTAGPTLALRVGGQRVFGTFPFLDAAYLGGASTVRGFNENRFAGHASLFGNAELRFRLARTRVIFPGGIGVLALGDVGRVYSDADTPGENTLHTAFGGGLWYSVLNPANTLALAIARSDERTGLYITAGFMF
ncbi:MAG: BamA/TamA family outer membrane protein, partial [Gemmatimonadetes bacterium]|nr:BamA/TamA family outer membrane protein [Gemmatimonadota bacterium]